MLFDIKNNNRFGIQDHVFTNILHFSAISKIGNFIDEEGYIGPTDCGAIAKDKKLAVIKAFSESIERRAIVVGALKKSMGVSPSFDLINNKTTMINHELTTYKSDEHPYIDTTGTAAHKNSNEANFGAVSELLEKNSIFLLWYAKVGYSLNLSFYSYYKEQFKKEGYRIYQYINDTFYPLLVVLVVAFRIEDKSITPITFKCGVGSGFILEDALEKAFSEAYMLGMYYENLYFTNYISQLSYDESNEYNALEYIDNEKVINWLLSLEKLKEYKLIKTDNINKNDSKGKLKMLIENMPRWVTNLQLTVLRQTIRKDIIVVKAFSKDLITHIPSKKYIDLNISINKNVAKLDNITLNQIPQCPII
jgi:hypothetical protein|nr:YcaO-like family protein [Heyndrickxia oleronia]